MSQFPSIPERRRVQLTESTNRILIVALAAHFARDGKTRAEHILSRECFDSLVERVNIPEGKAIRVVFEYVEEGVLCDPEPG